MQTVARVGSSEGTDLRWTTATVSPMAAVADPPGAAAARSAAGRLRPAGAFDDEREADRPVVALTREQAAALRQRRPPLSPWRVIALQAVVGAVLALAVGVVGGRALGWSLAWGAAAVVLPGVLLARGLSSPLTQGSAVGAAAGFLVWEMVKIAVSIAMLALAPTVVPALSWPALLVGLVLTMKVAWLSLLWQPAAKTKETGR